MSLEIQNVRCWYTSLATCTRTQKYDVPIVTSFVSRPLYVCIAQTHVHLFIIIEISMSDNSFISFSQFFFSLCHNVTAASRNTIREKRLLCYVLCNQTNVWFSAFFSFSFLNSLFFLKIMPMIESLYDPHLSFYFPLSAQIRCCMVFCPLWGTLKPLIWSPQSHSQFTYHGIPVSLHCISMSEIISIPTSRIPSAQTFTPLLSVSFVAFSKAFLQCTPNQFSKLYRKFSLLSQFLTLFW